MFKTHISTSNTIVFYIRLNVFMMMVSGLQGRIIWNLLRIILV